MQYIVLTMMGGEQTSQNRTEQEVTAHSVPTHAKHKTQNALLY